MRADARSSVMSDADYYLVHCRAFLVRPMLERREGRLALFDAF